ncbi:uncharacterized protein LOC110882380 [Helianthus annuus]|uniref:uncharacterized protein LOC110882380 n=1 Tax=Helianthus annuus TaxID=4232 RepID=UPI000B909A82|nr:uncharacterized protein LOC110882380 [Helianthus annuus]
MRLSEPDAASLTVPFSKEEIKRAVFECGLDKAPIPDGFNFNFIKSKGTIAAGCNSSFITLIPRNNDPVGLREYRPINLIGVISKTISKVLANRLKMVIGSIISKNQTAFLKGRYILDSPLMLNGLMAWIKKYNKKALLLKIDFEKAYDNVCWNFLLDIMGQMGFPELWCKWIKGILASARSVVLVNGSPTFEFNFFKGVRQSPFLFLLVMEALSSILSKARREDLFKGTYKTETEEMSKNEESNKDETSKCEVVCSKCEKSEADNVKLLKDVEKVDKFGKPKFCKFWVPIKDDDEFVSAKTKESSSGDEFVSLKAKEPRFGNESDSLKSDEPSVEWSRQPESEEELKEWMECCKVLSMVSLSNGKDTWFWSEDSKNGFSVKAVKSAFIKDRGSGHPPNFNWCKWVPIKCNIMNWRGNLDRIPSRLNLRRRNVDIPSTMCPLCKETEESVEHLFTACSIDLRVWTAFSEWCNIPPIYLFEFKDILDIHKFRKCSKEEKIIYGLALITSWCLWKERNEVVFNQKRCNLQDIIGELKSRSFAWVRNRSSCKSIRWTEWCKYPLYML